METREIRLSPLDFDTKAEDEDEKDKDGMTVKGHASVFNSLSEDLGGFREIVAPGAFTRSLEAVDDGDEDVRALAHHDTAQVLGRTSNGTLTLRQDDIGLSVRIDLPDTTVGRDTKTSIARKDLDKMSIGFNVPDGGDEWAFPEEGPAIRTVKEIDLFEVSVVAFPAFRQTDISLAQRSMEKAQKNARTVAPETKKARISPSTYERLLKQKQLSLKFDI